MELPLWNEKRYAPYKVAALAEDLGEQGIAPAASLSGTGLSPQSLADPDTLTSVRQYITVCRNALQHSKSAETPQRFVLSAYWALPSPARSYAFLADTLGGWSLATATVVQDGQESSITFNNIYNAYGITGDRASYAPGCNAKHVLTSGSVSSRVNNYINTACFAAPAVIGADGVATDFGNTPNGILREPDQADVDLSIAKSQAVSRPKEGFSVQLRADFFNALNHPNFAGPDNAYTSTPSAFGTITAMSTNPRVIQLALRFAF